jgi:NAD(P)-dependent dehydrogenase (short-subunit alcohol dehydrogenase family)
MTENSAIRDKVVVITGGARGIGFATATAFHNLGAKVAIGDVDEAKLKESGTALGLDVYGKLDVTDPESFSSFLDDVERQLGPLDVLINNPESCRPARSSTRRTHSPVASSISTPTA